MPKHAASVRAAAQLGTFALLLLVSGCSTTLKAAGPTATARPVHHTVPAPAGLTAQPAPLAVTLQWQAGKGTTDLMLFIVYRDGEEITRLPSNLPEYWDSGVTAGAHTYAVAETDGTLVSPQVTATVTVPAPAIADAVLTGLFDVHTTVASSYGFARAPSSSDFGWSFTPTCTSGPCSVTMSGNGDSQFSMVLSRLGATYTGSYKGPFSHCGTAVTTANFQLTITVTDAAINGTLWEASTFSGTLVERSTAQYGRVATGATMTVSGTR